MDLRTDLEKDLHDVIKHCLQMMQQPHVTKSDLFRVMTELRDANVRLTNMEFGCKSGRHASFCSCKAKAA